MTAGVVEQALAEYQAGPCMEALDWLLDEIRHEVRRAEGKHRPMNSAHEGYAVLLEEVDELWDEVKKQNEARSKDAMRKEAIQIAAMAIRFIRDVTDGGR